MVGGSHGPATTTHLPDGDHGDSTTCFSRNLLLGFGDLCTSGCVLSDHGLFHGVCAASARCLGESSSWTKNSASGDDYRRITVGGPDNWFCDRLYCRLCGTDDFVTTYLFVYGRSNVGRQADPASRRD